MTHRGKALTGPARAACLCLLLWASTAVGASADGLLDGRVYSGVIGPAENPDLPDSLHFDDGYFWSDICTSCGFVPGTYTATQTDAGIAFQGALVSDSRGRFDYRGVAHADGTMTVSIDWTRKRWYWTARREIAFRGVETRQENPLEIGGIRAKMTVMDPDSNPQCARF